MLGTWWLSSERESEDDRTVPPASGEFGTKETGAWKLTTVGSLLAGDQQLEDELYYSHPAIYGKTLDAKAVSLLRVGRVGSSTAMRRSEVLSGPAEERWSCELYTMGDIHVDPSATLQKVILSFDVTAGWANAFRDDAHGKHRVMNPETGTFTAPEVWKHSTSVRGVVLSLVRTWAWTYEFSRSFQASQTASFELEGSIPIDELRRCWVDPLQHLMSFLALNPARIDSITGYVQVDGEPDGVCVEIHMSEPKFMHEHDQAAGPLDLLATREGLEDAGMSVDELLQAWFELYDSARVSLVYLLSADLPHIYLETQSHFACLALEAFHNQFMDRKRWSPEYHNALVDKILKELDVIGLLEEEDEWLRQRLRDGNNKGQRKKILEVFEFADSTSNGVQDVCPGFDGLVKSQRNRTAHPQSSSGNDGGVSPMATKTGLRWILRHAYLRRLGMTNENITNLMEGCYLYQRDLRHLQEMNLHHRP